MSKIEKLIERMKTIPSDFTYKEMVTVLSALGFEVSNKGKTSGSRMKFLNSRGIELLLHRPHPQKEIKPYQVKQVVEVLRKEELI